jgi:hypothetical protein
MGEARKMGEIAYSWYATTVESSQLGENVLDPNPKKARQWQASGPEIRRSELGRTGGAGGITRRMPRRCLNAEEQQPCQAPGGKTLCE